MQRTVNTVCVCRCEIVCISVVLEANQQGVTVVLWVGAELTAH